MRKLLVVAAIVMALVALVAAPALAVPGTPMLDSVAHAPRR